MDVQASGVVTEGTFEVLNKEACLALPAPAPHVYSKWAVTLFESNRLQEALDAYTECLKLDPQDMNAMYNRGLIKGLLKDKEGALSDLSLVLLELSVFDMPLLIVRDEVSESIIEDAKALYQSVSSKDKEFSEAQAELEEINRDLKDTLKVLLDGPPVSKETNGARARNTEMVNGRIIHAGYSVPCERLSDVQGLETVKEVMWNNIVLPILRPDLFSKYKKKRSFAVLLYGPPGCGKTLLARALAGETDSYVVLAKLHELMDMYLGNTQKNIHSLFEEARALTRNSSRSCIVFLDELDAIGVDRALVARDFTSSHRDMVDQLLMELDGLDRNPEGLFVLAASNRPWDIDSALKRSGRIGETIYINPPAHKDRKCLFEYYLRDCVVGEIDFERLATLTDGCSAADIEGIVDKAKLLPIKREHQTGIDDALAMADLEVVLADPVTGKGSLGDWYLSVGNELSRGPLDAARYKPLIDDVKKVLKGNKSALVQTPCV
jgi:transitional endoplasmic reticulum ATPase